MKAAIFDFDGTLVDTMPIHFEAYRRVFAEEGLELTPEDFYENIGGKARETIPRFLRGRTTSRSVEELHERKKQLVGDLLETLEVPRLATAELLPFLHGLVPLAIASSGSRPGIEVVLRRFDWARYFGAVVTGEDADRGKPAPDLFLLAADRLEVAPEGCLVFEDTDDGVAAARSAGMAVFDVRRARARP